VGAWAVVVGVVVAGAVVGVEVPEDEEVPEVVVVRVVADVEEPVPEDVEVVGLGVVSAVAAVPGISLDTTSPVAAVAAMASTVTPLVIRRTRSPARSRRAGPGQAGSPRCRVGRTPLP
jgi:hypothetical protein